VLSIHLIIYLFAFFNMFYIARWLGSAEARNCRRKCASEIPNVCCRVTEWETEWEIIGNYLVGKNGHGICISDGNGHVTETELRHWNGEEFGTKKSVLTHLI